MEFIDACTFFSRPQSEWIYNYTNGFGNKIGHCSKCKYPCERYNYCPICGAEIKGGRE